MKDYPSKTNGFHSLPIAVVVIVGAAFSLFLFFAVRQTETITLQREFRRMAQNRVLTLKDFIRGEIAILESVRCFFESSQRVEGDEFESFTASLSELEEVDIIAWAPCVQAGNRPAFEMQMQAQDPAFFIKEQQPQGTFIPARNRDVYYPVQYIEPFTEANRIALGYDVGSEDERNRALTSARDHDLAVATGAIQLVQDRQDHKSFLIFLPVYKPVTLRDTVQQRRENLEGFVIGAFYIQTLVERAMRLTDLEHISVCLSDISDPEDVQFLCYYSATGSLSSPDQYLARETLPTQGLYTSDIIDVGTRQWSEVCCPRPALVALYMTGNEWALLTVGLLLTFIIVLYVRVSRRKTEAIQRLVDIRTEELSRELGQRKRAEEKLEAKNDELERVIYVASHDLRSPLITISGFDNELQKSCRELKSLIDQHVSPNTDVQPIRRLIDEAIPESLSFITAGVEKANLLIDGLLQVSRVGTSPFTIEAINMNELMANVIDIQQFQARVHHADITVGELPDCMGDVAKTNQVFSNLIDNALKYLSPDRPGKITITGRRDRERCIYCVEDNGIGVEPEQQSRIFGMFNRSCPDSSVKGEGLGLAIVVRILEGQDGDIWIESEPGKGSRFYVSLLSA